MKSHIERMRVVMLATDKADSAIFFQLYIISNAKIKAGDWCLHYQNKKDIAGNFVFKCKKVNDLDALNGIYDEDTNYIRKYCFKIEATTDSSLKMSKDFGEISKEILLPQIPESFIMAYVSTIDDVEVEMEIIVVCKGNNGNGCFMDSCGHDCGCLSLKPKLNPDNSIIIHFKNLEYWRLNAEEDYMTTPISVLRYITELEDKLKLQK